MKNASKNIYPWPGNRAPWGHWSFFENHRKYIKWLEGILGYTKPEDWYKVRHKDFKKYGGQGLLVSYYNDSPYHALTKIVPEYNLKFWLFKLPPSGLWRQKIYQKEYLEWLFIKLGYKEPEDWYKITIQDFKDNKGGGTLLKLYNSSRKAVQSNFPELKLKTELFKHIPSDSWQREENRKKYFKKLGKILGYKKPEDWYWVKKKDFIDNGGGGLLVTYYRNSPSLAVKTLCDCYDFKDWLFHPPPNSFWPDIKNQKKYMSWLGNILGYNEPSDWYKVSQSSFKKYRGNRLLELYQKSPTKIVQKFISGYDFITWKFKNVPLGFWSNKENRKEYMEWLGKGLNFTQPEDWYVVTYDTFLKNHGGTFIGYYNDSPLKAVSEKYPDYEFLPWLFKHVPPNYWTNMKHQKKYLVWLGKKHGYKNPDEATETEMKEWYNITQDAFYKSGGDGLLINHYGGSPSLAVMEIFSNYKWKPEEFSKYKKNQKIILKIIEKRFPNEEIEWDYKHPKLRYKTSNYRMELDVFVRSQNLAIEYQGEQHFFPVPHFGGKKGLQKRKSRDQEKRKACKKNGIILIEIPYTWDGKEDTVIEEIERKLKSKNRNK